MGDWKDIKPKVNEEIEFLEIASDFGDPMELFREALHNAYDWHAKTFSIDIRVEDRNGVDKLIIELKDDGDGMNYDQLTNNFWDLGNSASKGSEDKIGEKGHGTKIYLRSERIIVITSDGEKAFESVCEGPFGTLNDGKKHNPKVREISNKDVEKGTTITIEAYNNNNMEIYTQDVVKDYLYWKTVLGSFETEFDGKEKPDFKVLLKALDVEEFEELEFGHIFAKENNDIDKLFDEYKEDAADHFVKKYVYQNQSLDKFPHIKYDVVIYVEGDEAKKEYNPLLKKRKNPKKGSYKVSDRYGIYLCKDYIPIQRVNEWVSGFGTGSNSVVMLHGFINCQKLRLTANRGSVANTNPEIVNELKKAIDEILNEIDVDLYDNNIDEIKRWQDEIHTKEVEEAAFKKRKKLIETKKIFKIDERTFLEPRNEAELYGIFISLYTLHPDSFNFEPLDYDESIGVDLVARNKTENPVSDSEYWYVELKYILSTKEFNHSFDNIRIIVCWDISDKLKDGSIISSSSGDKDRVFKKIINKKGMNKYYLDSDDASIKIEVIPIKEYLEKVLRVEIMDQ